MWIMQRTHSVLRFQQALSRRQPWLRIDGSSVVALRDRPEHLPAVDLAELLVAGGRFGDLLEAAFARTSAAPEAVAIFNDKVLSLAKTILFQLCTKRLVIGDLWWGSAIGAEKRYSRDLAGLLRTRR
jgi:hypothetical protein